MSRSIKKNMGGTITGSGLKDDCTTYHRIERSKSKGLLKAIVRDNNEGDLSDKVVKNRIDYSVRYSDSWSWGSDGGSYLMETNQSLEDDFDKYITNNKDLWKEYERWIKRHYDYWVRKRFFMIVGDKVESEEELRALAVKYRDKTIRAVKKIDFGK